MNNAICSHLDWIWFGYAAFFAVLAVVAWFFRGEGPRRPLQLIWIAVFACVVFWLSIVDMSVVHFLPGVSRFLMHNGLISSICMIAAPVSLGAAFALARGSRLFVLAVSFALLAVNPVFTFMAGMIFHCPFD